jgi:hypothetical protein
MMTFTALPKAHVPHTKTFTRCHSFDIDDSVNNRLVFERKECKNFIAQKRCTILVRFNRGLFHLGNVNLRVAKVLKKYKSILF